MKLVIDLSRTGVWFIEKYTDHNSFLYEDKKNP